MSDKNSFNDIEGRRNGFQSFEHAAADIVLAASFNTSGTRIILCSADHRIRVYNIDQSDEYFLVDQWRGHDAEVLDASIALLLPRKRAAKEQFEGPMACVQSRSILCNYRRRQQVQTVARRPITGVQKWTTLQVHFLAVAA